jgi:hypothetical protein
LAVVARELGGTVMDSVALLPWLAEEVRGNIEHLFILFRICDFPA